MNRDKPVPSPVACDVPSLPHGWHAFSCKVLAGSRLAILAADVDLRSAWRSDRRQDTEGETSRVAATVTASVWTFDGDDLIEAAQFTLLESFPIIDQFPDGRWLVTTPRSRGQGNARILRREGRTADTIGKTCVRRAAMPPTLSRVARGPSCPPPPSPSRSTPNRRER